MNKEYSAGLMSQSFWFVEMKKVLNLIKSGKCYDEIRNICLSENIFGAINEYRAKRMCNYVINRAKLLSPDMMELFFTSDLQTQKLINLISILKSDRLFFEFVYEVYRENIILGNYQISDSDLNVFFNNKELQSEVVLNWKESTKKHLKSTFINYLFEANILGSNRKTYTILPPILDIALERYLIISGEETIVNALTGVK